jgi:predicted CopG family antitoxin
MSKVVRVSDETYEKIAKEGSFNESFDNLLSRLLEKVLQ